MTTRFYKKYEPFSIARFVALGKDAAHKIRAVRAGGHNTARKFTAFYNLPQTQESQARSVVAGVKRIGNPKPFFLGTHTSDSGKKTRVLYVLNFLNSCAARRATYFPAKSWPGSHSQE
jgi:hypothetical protein